MSRLSHNNTALASNYSLPISYKPFYFFAWRAINYIKCTLSFIPILHNAPLVEVTGASFQLWGDYSV
jgi:hypothetical protein